MGTGVVAPDDHVIVGVSHHNLLAAGYGWPDAGLRVRSGADGADLVLQEVMTTENLEGRFGAAILVTGDGGFAHSVAALTGRGLPLGVIAPKGRLSAALRLAASAAREIAFTPGVNTSWSA
ncbi:NYN domain-containing protein [Mycolicibacter algericus]|nr:NYN domain-containing protein [Mycolicibacter algericus]